MYSRILVPLDGSQVSAAILPYVRWLARGLGCAVELLHVDSPHSSIAPARAALNAGDSDISAALPEMRNVEYRIERGNPAGVIIAVAQAGPRTLVAMATHGYSGARRWVLGSVAEKVLHGLDGDMLLIRPLEADSIGEVELKTCVVPLDGSGLAETIGPTIVELAKRLKLEVQLLHVTRRIYTAPPEGFLPLFSAVPNLEEIWKQDRDAASKYLGDKAIRLRQQGIANVAATVIEGGVGGVAGEIIDFAQGLSASLIALTRHGRTGVGRWLLGSVTEKVVRHSHRPVLIVGSQNIQGN